MSRVDRYYDEHVSRMIMIDKGNALLEINTLESEVKKNGELYAQQTKERYDIMNDIIMRHAYGYQGGELETRIKQQLKKNTIFSKQHLRCKQLSEVQRIIEKPQRLNLTMMNV